MDTFPGDPASRIKKIVAAGVKPGWRDSDVMLLNEYVNRVIELERQMGRRVGALFFDPSKWPAEDGEQLRLECRYARELTNGFSDGQAAWRMICYAYWVHLIKRGNPVAVAYPMLFEPLMRMLERGATFLMRHGEADFERSRMPLEIWRSRNCRRMFELDDESLDREDQQAEGPGS